MNLSNSGVRQPSNRSHKKGRPQGGPPQQAPQQPPSYGDLGGYQPQPGYPMNAPVQNQQMFDPRMPQTATYYDPGYAAPGHMPPGGNYYPQQPGNYQQPQAFMTDPMANMAMAYGQTLVGQGKQMVDEKLEKYVPISKLKYYFAVDTTYVRRKLTLVFFPFVNSDWSIKYSQDEPVAPRYEINAPDLYIPVMAFVTFILLAGISLGTQNKFSPEQLGIHASSALGWLVLEVIILLITTYIMNIQTDLSYLDIIAFSSYKYAGMIFSVLVGLFFMPLAYYLSLAYCAAAVCFFLVKTMRVQIVPKAPGEHMASGNKRRMYFLLCIAVIQPLVMYWLTRNLVPDSVSPTPASGATL